MTTLANDRNAYHLIGYVVGNPNSIEHTDISLFPDQSGNGYLVIQKVSPEFANADGQTKEVKKSLTEAWIFLCKLSEHQTTIAFKFGQVSKVIPKDISLFNYVVGNTSLQLSDDLHYQEWVCEAKIKKESTGRSSVNYLEKLSQAKKNRQKKRDHLHNLYDSVSSGNIHSMIGNPDFKNDSLSFQIVLKAEDVDKFVGSINKLEISDELAINLSGPQPLQLLPSKTLTS